MSDALKTYQSKRHFDITPEPGGEEAMVALRFVIQKHWATTLHYDFRLELDGVMKSWAVPKGPSYDSRDKRLAVHVEDHPISYNAFEGAIPEKQYGAGKVVIWDAGTWIPLADPHEGYASGNLRFELRGHKLHGKWALVRIHKSQGKQEAWLLIKERDEYTRPATEFSVVDEMPDSVTGLPALAASEVRTSSMPKDSGNEADTIPKSVVVKNGPRNQQKFLSRLSRRDVRARRCHANARRNSRPWSKRRRNMPSIGHSRSNSMDIESSRASTMAMSACSRETATIGHPGYQSSVPSSDRLRCRTDGMTARSSLTMDRGDQTSARDNSRSAEEAMLQSFTSCSTRLSSIDTIFANWAWNGGANY